MEGQKSREKALSGGANRQKRRRGGGEREGLSRGRAKRRERASKVREKSLGAVGHRVHAFSLRGQPRGCCAAMAGGMAAEEQVRHRKKKFRVGHERERFGAVQEGKGENSEGEALVSSGTPEEGVWGKGGHTAARTKSKDRNRRKNQFRVGHEREIRANAAAAGLV